jgi:hypothetical protein
MIHFFLIFIGLSQLLNTLLGGWPDETTSARSYRMRHKKFWYVMYRGINLLFFWQADHCKWAYDLETKLRPIPAWQRDMSKFKELFK